MQPVDSEAIEAIGYDEATSQLRVKLRESGETYVYSLVPSQVFDELLAAESKGAIFDKWVRAKPYPYERLD